jgi:8-oxo-dGTP pyrophosphatase MutT (NUDIX family)
MIKIFSPDKIFYLVDSEPSIKTSDNRIFVSVHSLDELKVKYKQIVNNKLVTEVYFIYNNVELLLERFSSMFLIVAAAGGLVKNQEGKWLFIFRNGKWDLPKGKIEKNEAIKTAAVREVEEECGITQLSIVKDLPTTYHTYSLKGKAILKPIYWFEMTCTDTSPLVPQIEEGITDVRWFDNTEAKKVAANTYGSIKEVLKNIVNQD